MIAGPPNARAVHLEESVPTAFSSVSLLGSPGGAFRYRIWAAGLFHRSGVASTTATFGRWNTSQWDGSSFTNMIGNLLGIGGYTTYYPGGLALAAGAAMTIARAANVASTPVAWDVVYTIEPV